MAKDDIHEPQLPGVKTLQHDANTDSLGISFLHHTKDTDMRTPTAPGFKEPRSSVLTNTGDVFNVTNAYDDSAVETGTIVTDRRQKRNSFGSLFKEAFNEWWEDTSTSLKKIDFAKTVERPTVVKAEERKEVITEAAQFTRQVPRDDHTVVVEKLKTLAHDAERVTGKPYIIKKPEVAQTPAWNTTETQTSSPAPTLQKQSKPERTPTLDLRAVTVAPVIQKHVESSIKAYARPNTQPAPAEAAVRVPEVPKISNAPSSKTQEKKSNAWKFFAEIKDERPKAFSNPDSLSVSIPKTAPRVTPPPEHPLPPPTVPRTPEPPAPAPTIETATQNARPIISEPKAGIREHIPRVEPIVPHTEAVTRPLEINPTKLQGEKEQRHTQRSHLRTIIFVLVIIVGATGGVLTGIYVSKGTISPQEEPETVMAPARYLRADRSTPLTMEIDRGRFMTALQTSVATVSNGVTQVYPVRENTAATNEEIIDTLALRIDGAFTRSLEEGIMFGGVYTDKSEPFMVLRSFTFDTAFAGMLDWEPFMSEDLAPLFGDASENEQLFVDALAQNRSIRILYDASGNEKIIYAFVNRDTIIITTSTRALSALIERL